ncbi:thioredoxin family protein [bacterium]|jgi:thioredoxin-like negative regulator of GroEL|nr:thioredoxin family protein [bacterium]MBT3903844.1 thioredoxin family protein [bacterium]MBT4577718.1 thioredoxin family protein [bacterium]MBT5345612.1 thioredoxin family protein [bacterium]MBT6130701.1 thioredoxin family protein [bacterium]
MKISIHHIVAFASMIMITGCIGDNDKSSKAPAQTKAPVAKANAKADKGHKSTKSHVVELEKGKKIEHVIGKKAIVKFHANWCPACGMMKKEYKELAHKLSEKLDFISVNIDHHPELANKHNVKYIPHVVYLEKVGEELKEKAVREGESLKDFVHKYV